MARAGAAHASLRSDSIKGLAHSIARPAYRRLLTAEPALRRAVPALIIAFLATIAIGAAVQIADRLHQAVRAASGELNLIADVVAREIDRHGHSFADLPSARKQELFEQALAGRGADSKRRVILLNAAGQTIASTPQSSASDFALDLLAIAKRMGNAVPGIPDETAAEVLAASRSLSAGLLVVSQPRAAALAAWRSDTALTITLIATTGCVLLILGFAFHWQASRAREADLIYDTVQSRIDTALNRGRCGLWDWDLASGRMFWSTSMFDILGLQPSRDLLTFGEVSALAHPDDVKLYELAAQLADQTATSIDRVFRMRHASGAWVWLRMRSELVQQPDEPGPHLVGIAVDVSEQQMLAAKSAAADLRLRDSIEALSEAFVLWDAEKHLVMCNSKFRSLHQLCDDMARPGTPYERMIGSGEKPIMRARLMHREPSAPEADQYETKLEDGRWLHVSERRTKDGGLVSVGTDITSLKSHEQALERQAQQLAYLAEKYAEEKMRAECASRAKSEFLASVSHELRTPLNAIIGFSEIMESGVFGPLGDARYDQYCRDINISGRYLLQVISDILDMANIEAGRLRLDVEEVALDSIVPEAVRVLAPRAQNKGIAVRLDVERELRLLGDRRALTQIVFNLLSNAVKFTPDGGRVSLRTRARCGGVVLAIEDTGIGIRRDALRMLGQPFGQIASQMTRAHEGSGLGLAIARSLVELHGGVMRIRSTVGRGTTVLVRFPDAGSSMQDGLISDVRVARG